MSADRSSTNHSSVRTSPRDDDFPPGDDEVASRGSSVSADFVDEYNQLLQYAVVLPSLTNANAQMTAQLRQPSTPTAACSAKKASNASHRRAVPAGAPREETVACEASVEMIFEAGPSSDVMSSSGVHSDITEAQRSHHPVELPNHRSNDAPARSRAKGPSPSGSESGFDMFDKMARQMKKAVRQELLQGVLAEQERSVKQLEHQRNAFAVEMQQLLGTLGEAQQEIERLGRECQSKDNAVEAVLTNLERQRKELLAARAFYRWKDRLKDRRLETYENRLADRLYQMNVLRRSINAWKSGGASQWRERVKLNCQSHAEHVCHVLAEKYESKLAKLQSELHARNAENDALRHQREEFQDRMKEAFMRGVCALNLEAMKVLSPTSSKANSQTALDLTPTIPKPSQRALFNQDDHEISGICQILLENATERASLPSSPRAKPVIPCSPRETTAGSNISTPISQNSSGAEVPMPLPQNFRNPGSDFQIPGNGYQFPQDRFTRRNADSLGEHSTDDVSSDMSTFSHKDLLYSYNERCRLKRCEQASGGISGSRSPPRIISAPHPPQVRPQYAMLGERSSNGAGLPPQKSGVHSQFQVSGQQRRGAVAVSQPKTLNSITALTTTVASHAVHENLPKASKILYKSTKAQQQQAVGPNPSVAASSMAGAANNFHVHRHHFSTTAKSLLSPKKSTNSVMAARAALTESTANRSRIAPPHQPIAHQATGSGSTTTSSGGCYGTSVGVSSSTSHGSALRSVGEGQDAGLRITSQVIPAASYTSSAPPLGRRTGATRADLVKHRY